MIETFLILVILQNLLYSSEQIILVVSDNFNTAKATLRCFEDKKEVFDAIDVNIGKNGLGWGIGEYKLSQNSYDPIKKEGDKKAPGGIFKLSYLFGYEKNKNYKMNYMHVDENYICVDDSTSKYYNSILNFEDKTIKSFEYMKRKDDQYKLGIVVQHNNKRTPYAGSCIFIHVQKADNVGTAGCTSMHLDDIKKIIAWLDGSKNPILIQIPESSLKEIKKLYPNLPL